MRNLIFSPHKMKVLIVHRQEAVLQNIKSQMTNWYVKTMSSGLDGLIACKLEVFDLILCGQSLPVVTGIELVRSIRNMSLNKHTPVVLLAEGNETEEHERILNILHANLMTMEEVTELGNFKLNVNLDMKAFTNYQMGLLHFAHLLCSADGAVDERETKAMAKMRQEEGITEAAYQDFILAVIGKSERQVYEEAQRLLAGCTKEEKIAVIVHLFRLSDADENMHKREVRLLFYSLSVMDVDFEDVELTARMAGSKIG